MGKNIEAGIKPERKIHLPAQYTCFSRFGYTGQNAVYQHDPFGVLLSDSYLHQTNGLRRGKALFPETDRSDREQHDKRKKGHFSG